MICFASFGPAGTCFDSFELAANNAADSRLWGGIHYRFDNDAGLQLGHNIAAFNLSQGLFQAVPEPSTWMMMLLGFGLMGWRVQRAKCHAAPLPA